MQRFLLFVLFTVLSIFWFRDFVASGRFLAQADAHPSRRGTATALYVLGRYYDIFNKPDKAVAAYGRVARRYPKSRYGMEAQHGLAEGYERLKDYRRALEEYQRFLDEYPGNRYAVSVRNNVEILKSR